jgi:molecular chaperone GrpE
MKKTIKKLLNMDEKDPQQREEEGMEKSAGEQAQNPQTAETGSQKDKLRTLEAQLEEAKNKYLYLLSDFENYKRNAARERMDLISTAGRDIMASMLPILDDFDRAAKNDGLTEGMILIHQKLVHTLKSKGLHGMELKIGDDFNTDQHEALAEIPAPAEAMQGKIVDIIDQGYLLGDKVLRFAKVVVGK